MTTDPLDHNGVDLETLAAYVDGRLTAQERAAVEAKLAADEDSYELLVELMRTQDAVNVAPRPATSFPSRSSRSLWIGGALAAAAALVLAVRFAPGSFLDRSNEPFAALVSAVNGERIIEPRLTGGFPAGPIRSATRGSASPDPATRGTSPLSSQNLSLIAAVGEAQNRAQAEPSARNLHAWGVGLVLLGSLDEAIETLESASANEPANAAVLSDLAAAYAVRAANTLSARDWSNALDRSERALRQPEPPLEASFNRALALEALQLDAARTAWQDYLDRDAGSEWAREARERLSKLAEKPQGSRRGDNDAAIRTALDAGATGVVLERAVRSDPQRAREWLEEELTREWAVAVIARDGQRETRTRARAERLLNAYAAVARDALPGEALSHLWSRVADRIPVAFAMQQFADAAQLVREDRLTESSAMLAKALPVLQASGSPLALWGRTFVVLDWSQQGRLAECLAELERLQAAADPRGYSVLSGTLRNRRGQILGRQGNQEGAIRERIAAISYFERAADVDQIAVMHSMLAEAYRYLGDTRSAWTHHDASLKRLDETPNHRSRHLVLVQAGMTATLEGQFDAAIAIQRQVVENGRDWRRASGTATGFLHQARNTFRLGLLDDADVAIREARALTSQIPDAAFRDRIELELLEVEGEVFGNREPAAGLPVITTAVDRFARQGFAVRQANLLLWRGRLHARAGDTAAAEGDWQRALQALEAERATVSAESLRLAQAGSLRSLYNEIALSRVKDGRSAAESLAPLERGRARTLVEDALGVARPTAKLQELQQQLDPYTGVLHYAIGESDAVVWLTTRNAILSARLPVTARAVHVLADRYRRLTLRSREAQLASAQDLYRVLIAPIGSSIDGLTSLVVVPDPALAGVSFGALNNPATGAYLIESTSVAMAPSAALLAEPASHPSSAEVLLVGADRPDGLAPLPWVGNELARLEKVYGRATVLTGADATRARLLAEAPRASVIHFAGHAFGNATNPLLSRLVLHRGDGDRSDLYAFELGSLDVSAATVVLAACQTGYAGAGAQDDDGVLAMARPFLARGARAVLATYRDVSDRGAPALMEQFHRHLKNGKTPSQAWQATAVDAIRAPNGSSEWTAYAVFLGRGSLAAAPARPMTNDTSSGGK